VPTEPHVGDPQRMKKPRPACTSSSCRKHKRLVHCDQCKGRFCMMHSETHQCVHVANAGTSAGTSAARTAAHASETTATHRRAGLGGGTFAKLDRI
jgi:hypothetical protein